MEEIYPEDDHQLAAMCGTWQQLHILRRRREDYKSGKVEKKDLSDMTRSERLMWYRNNIDKVDQEREQAGYCSNYQQLQLARGKGLGLAERAGEDTRSQKINWYRNGGREVVEQEKYLAGLCSNWRQFHLLTRGPALRAQRAQEEEQEEEALTRSEKLVWYRQGGEQCMDEQKHLASNSENWIQYKLTRDAKQHAKDLDAAVQTKYSDFSTKEALLNYISEMRTQGLTEREEIRRESRSRHLRDTVTKSAYDFYLQPYAGVELAAASSKSLESRQKISQLEENLRLTTESVMMMRTSYAESAREMAMRAIKEDEAAVAASRMKRKTTIVEGQQAVSAAA